jgi:hypothetical protein
VREAELLEQPEALAGLGFVEAGGGPLTHAVYGEHGGLVEGRAVEGARGVAAVVVAEEHLVGVDTEVRHQRGLHPELVGQPIKGGAPKGGEALREVEHLVHQDALEFTEGLLVIDEVVEVSRLNAGLLEAPAGGQHGETGVVLEAAEALLGGRRHQDAILEEGGRGVVIERRDAEDPGAHPSSRAVAMGSGLSGPGRRKPRCSRSACRAKREKGPTMNR